MKEDLVEIFEQYDKVDKRKQADLFSLAKKIILKLEKQFHNSILTANNPLVAEQEIKKLSATILNTSRKISAETDNYFRDNPGKQYLFTELVKLYMRIKDFIVEEISLQAVEREITFFLRPEVKIAQRYEAYVSVGFTNDEVDAEKRFVFGNLIDVVLFKFFDQNETREYQYYLFVKFEYYKLLIRWALESYSSYEQQRKINDFNYFLFHLNITISRIGNTKLSKEEREVDFVIAEDSKQIESVRNKAKYVFDNFYDYFEHQYYSERSMYEQLRDYLKENREVFLRSKSTIIKEDSFELKTSRYDSEMIKVLNHLIKNEFVSPETTIGVFKSIFQKGKILNRVNWISNPSSLKFFIDYLIQREIIVEPPRKQKWEITTKCFQLILNGEEYHYLKYRTLKKPSKKIQEQIKYAVRTIT